MRRVLASLAAVAAVGLPGRLDADPPMNCVYDSIPLVAFGSYDPTLPTAANATGSIEFTCKGKDFNVQIAINAGSSGSVRSRTMLNGTAILNYNLYQDAGLSRIWGDFITEPGVTIFNEKNNTSYRLPVYGSIDAQQDPTIGVYGDSLLVTLMF